MDNIDLSTVRYIKLDKPTTFICGHCKKEKNSKKRMQYVPAESHSTYCIYLQFLVNRHNFIPEIAPVYFLPTLHLGFRPCHNSVQLLHDFRFQRMGNSLCQNLLHSLIQPFLHAGNLSCLATGAGFQQIGLPEIMDMIQGVFLA